VRFDLPRALSLLQQTSCAHLARIFVRVQPSIFSADLTPISRFGSLPS